MNGHCKGQRQRASERAGQRERERNEYRNEAGNFHSKSKSSSMDLTAESELGKSKWLERAPHNHKNPSHTSNAASQSQPIINQPITERKLNENWLRWSFLLPTFRPLLCGCSVCCVSTTKFGREFLCSGRDLDTSFVDSPNFPLSTRLLPPPYVCACIRQQQHPTQHHLEGKCGRPNNECLVLNNYQHSYKTLRRVCVCSPCRCSPARACVCVCNDNFLLIRFIWNLVYRFRFRSASRLCCAYH